MATFISENNYKTTTSISSKMQVRRHTLRQNQGSLKPEKLLRQHTYVYIALLLMTALLIYFYSYPLEISPINTSFSNDLILEFKSNGKAIFYKDANSTKSVATSTVSGKAPAVKYNNTNSTSKPHIVPYTSITKASSRAVRYTSYGSTIDTEPTADISHNTSHLVSAPQTVTTSHGLLDKQQVSKEIQSSSFKKSRTSYIINESKVQEIKEPFSKQNNVTKKDEGSTLGKMPDLSPLGNKDAQHGKQETTTENLDPSQQRGRPSQKILATTTLYPSSSAEKHTVNTTTETEVISNQTTTLSDKKDNGKNKENKHTSFQPNNVSQRITDKYMEETENPNTKDRFLVNTKNCKIPDIDPMHPNILQFVKFTDPLICKNKDPLTKTDGNTLFIDKEAVKNRSLNEHELFCCYRPLYRAKEGSSDNKISFGHCHDFKDKANIRDEFIKVQCAYKNETTFYEEYHSFIHDKTHVEERCNKYNNSKYSVLIIGLDSMSRMNMHRQMNKTYHYLMDKMEAVEMYGFNKVGDNTFPNLIPLLTGYDERELPQVCFNQSNEEESLDKCNFLWKSFAKNGYRTLYAEDSPYISTFNYVKKGFFYQPTDYYIRHFMLAYEKALGHKKTLNCYTCIGSVSATEAILHWAEQFASHFKDRSYFAFNWINSLTHDYMNLASSGDHMYEQFFRSLHQSGAFNRTIVIVMGDHGMRWGAIRETYIGRLEERLPMLLIALPPDFKKEFPNESEALRVNAHRLVTPFDLHSTLTNLLHLKDRDWVFSNSDNVSSELASNFTNRARSLFQTVAEDRSCDEASIEEHWCTCESSLPMDTDDNYVTVAAEFLVKKLNDLLKPMHKKCARLKLTTISDARVWSPSSEHIGHTKNDHILTVIVQTSPSKAMFEGTVRISLLDETCELLGTVSRLNLYGNQSSCIQDAVLRKYCYCL